MADKSLRGSMIRAKNKYWAAVSPPRPKMAGFAQDRADADRAQASGPIGRLFFENDAEIVHKWLHYLPIYEKLFAPFVGTPVRFLEIGVSKGGSLRLWRRYFGDAATLFGIDVDPTCAAQNGRYAQVRIGSQDDAAFLGGVVAEMGGLDVVLDDGSHVARHQRASFETLFPKLSEGGLYVLEDLQTAYWPNYEGGLRRPGTAIEFLKAKVDDMHRPYFARGANVPHAMTDIESVQFFDAIAAVAKRKQAPRRHVMSPTPGG